MKEFQTVRFKREFKKFSKEVRFAFAKQIGFLLNDIRHPSLRAKKYDEARGIWQARVTNNVRFYFSIKDDCYILLDIEKHRD
ncbi:hypothetical protein A3B35_00140 [Candidatus Kaiserbacteria bacterium RIFCSPLOWO2_01_FULL_54_24]|uniref:Uncharacterized protein n=1 Tax=Candidatus Kaiserbacteria bacterium RIFCSPLOWO2_01_FULL_54_24 TaxID=1798515 RepID=A0A1F6ESQ6_9BACT|nr:MAG: hypothetical protein A3B35_00140 [Candidatus Kaiserbacteria bacterium RIFCSPLOWO2_01_FULL_54_24]